MCKVIVNLTFRNFLQIICSAANASCPILIRRELIKNQSQKSVFLIKNKNEWMSDVTHIYVFSSTGVHEAPVPQVFLIQNGSTKIRCRVARKKDYKVVTRKREE